MKNFMKRVKQMGIVGALGLASSAAMADIPIEVTGAFTDLSADLATVGALVVVATVGVAVWKFVQAVII